MSSIYRQLEYNSNVKKITGVQFGILSPEEIFRRSVVHIQKTQLYENSGEPVSGGLFDPRMGVIERNKRCKTCELDYIFCPGHFGHIELAKPVFYFQYIYFILRICKSICLDCGRLLVDISHPIIKTIIDNTEGNNLQRFMEVSDLASKRRVCSNDGPEDIGNPHSCGSSQPSKYYRKDLKVFAEWKDHSSENNQLTLTPEFVLNLFRKIPIEDAYALGFSEEWCLPHWLICRVLPVAPPAVRPSVRQYNNQRCEDDLTHKYIDIIKHNNILRKKMMSSNSKEDTINYFFLVVQFHVATLIDNESQAKTSVTKVGRPLRTYKQRLHGKDGRIRGNLMGKRVDYSARSVITPDPNISIEELGVPRKIATNLTFPEIVNKFNYHKLYKLILNGPTNYPGAKRIKKIDNGKTIALDLVENLKEIADNLKNGDIVHRHLLDGDYVLFNRQPSLHKMSMMAHKIRVMDYSTFRLNVTVTTPYNADFDKLSVENKGA